MLCLPVGVNEAIKMFRVIDSEDPPTLLRTPFESAQDDAAMVAFARRDNNMHTGVSNGSHRVSHHHKWPATPYQPPGVTGGLREMTSILEEEVGFRRQYQNTFLNKHISHVSFISISLFERRSLPEREEIICSSHNGHIKY